MIASQNDGLPPIASGQLRWFTRYVRFYLRRNFHGLHLLPCGDMEELRDYPLLVCLNHPSWWDPLIALYLSQRFFPTRRQYAPIASEGLAKYRFFERLGFFGIDRCTRAGAARFLSLGETVLRQSNGAFWVTPQGAFSDIGLRPLVLASGVGHLASRLGRFAILPLALEYTFWNERLPESFSCFGKPLLVSDGRAQSSAEWTRQIAAALEETQDQLRARVQRRNPADFDPLLTGVGRLNEVWAACVRAGPAAKPLRAEQDGH